MLLLRGTKIVSARSTNRSFLLATSGFHQTWPPLHQRSIQYRLSDIGEGIAEVQIKDWLVKVGDKVCEFDDLCTVQSDKASVTITSRYTGVVSKLYYSVDDIAPVGQPLVDIDVSDDESGAEQLQVSHSTAPRPEIDDLASAPSSTTTSPGSGKILATPAIRRMIKEMGIERAKLPPGSGLNGRLLKEDLLKLGRADLKNEKDAPDESNFIDEQFFGSYINAKSNDQDNLKVDRSNEHSRPPEQTRTSQPSVVGDRVEPIRGYTRAMFKTMTEALRIPHFVYSDEFQMDALICTKNMLNKAGCKDSPKLSFLPLIIKATSLALLDFPILNASIDEKMENLIIKSSHNISVAVDTSGGLVVPNVKNCQAKTVWEISADLNRLMSLARAQKLDKEDLGGGTISLSNIGALNGCTYASPVILPPQLVIGAIGMVRRVPRFDDEDRVIPVQVMHFSWAADHRVIDGATVARFSNRLKELIEHPLLMLAKLR